MEGAEGVREESYFNVALIAVVRLDDQIGPMLSA